MLHSGALSLPVDLHFLLPLPRIPFRSRKKLRAVAANSSTAEPSRAPPPQFTYDLADPSIRWPNLRVEDLSPSISDPKYEFPPPQLEPMEPDEQQPEPAPDVAGTDAEYAGEGELQSLDVRRSRTRVKKMTKLALKRAQDWRQRVQYLTDRILGLDSGNFVADVLDKKPVQMTPTDYCFVVKQVGQSSWQRALEVYEWLNLRRWYSPDARMVATIISVLGRARKDSLAEEIFLRATSGAEEEGVSPTVQVYNAMMGVYARSGRFDEVQELLDVMRSRGCEPDLVSFNTLINARVKSGNMPSGSAMELIGEVRRSGIRPDTITYNTLISACSHTVNLEEAMEIYEDMETSGCRPDLWTYNSMLSVYGRCGMVMDAKRIFHELGSRGFSPDAVTYNSLLYAFAREGDSKEVERICDQMVAAGFKKDEITYNTIIHMYGKHGMQELALRYYEDMKLDGCRPDAVTYTVLIDSLGKADRASEAAKVMSEMVDAGVRPTLKTYSALICGYAKAGMREQAEKTFNHMVRSGVQPDNLAYSVMLDIVLRSGDLNKAMGLYREMIRNGYKPDTGLYQVIIATFIKNGDKEVIQQVVDDMESLCGFNRKSIITILVKGDCLDMGANMLKEAILQGDEVDHATFLPLLHAFCSQDRLDDAWALVNLLKQHSSSSHELISEASILVLCGRKEVETAIEEYNKLVGSGFQCCSQRCYEILISCCEQTEFLSQASQLYSDMQFQGLEFSYNIYKNMISVFCKLNLPETAHYLLEKAESSGLSFADCSPHLTLIESYGRLKLLQRAESLVGKLKLEGKVDRKLWNALIHAYAESGRYEQARAIFNTMMREGISPSVESVNGLMQALIVDGRLEELYVVVQELQDMDFKISKATILLMLDAFARAGNIFEVKKIYSGMKAAGYFPNMHLYRSMISLLSRGKRVRDVETMILEMEQAGLKPDLSIYNSLLRMYTRIEDFKKATGVHQKIQESGFQADEETYDSLILMYSKDRRPEEGLTLLNEMKRQGLEPKSGTYKSLLAACGRDHLWEQAEQLFEIMTSNACRPDRSVYHIMLKIYRDSGNHSKAELLLSRMKEVGLQPTIATMHMVMDTYGAGGLPQEAENILKNLKNSGLDLSTLPYASVIDAYIKAGDYDLAIDKLLAMKKDGLEPDHRIWTCFIRGASLCQKTSDAMFLLGSLKDAGFDLPVRLLSGKSKFLVREVDYLLDEIGFEDNASFNFMNSLENLLWAFEQRATASWVFQLAIKKGIYRHDIFRYSP